MNSVNLREPSSKQEETMNDLNMFRALQQSRQIIEEGFNPREPIRLASEVTGTTTKYLSVANAKITNQAKPKQWNVG